jgi:LuxR family maltose regulon positive regulatory protein
LRERVDALERARRSRQEASLSERELVVLRMLNGPLSEREIGRELFVSHNTIHTHTKSIYRKLEVSSRVAAVRRGRFLGLL